MWDWLGCVMKGGSSEVTASCYGPTGPTDIAPRDASETRRRWRWACGGVQRRVERDLRFLIET